MLSRLLPAAGKPTAAWFTAELHWLWLEDGRFRLRAASGKKLAAPKVAPKVRDVPTVYCAKVVRH